MKVLVVGGGGREHALAWKVAQSQRVTEVLVAPGNAGTAREARVRNIKVAADDIDGLLGIAREEQVGLTLVGPEQPLVAGIVDRFTAAGLDCFGPTAEAAQLEGSKAFCKAFLERHGIPTATHRTFSEIDPALAWIRERGAPIVVKADGLAAGKGVVVAQSTDDAEQAVRDMLGARRFGDAGRRIVVEDFLDGEEASFMALVAGGRVLPMATSQDHKARDDGDRGPNTGGMGAYSPAPVVTPEVRRRIMQEVMQPTVDGLAADGIEYCGFLYAGLMIAADGTPRVLEFNCRLGDPETQPVMMRLDSDLVALCHAAVGGDISSLEIKWQRRAALGVVMAAGGYPADYARGAVIEGLDSAAMVEHTKVFHAGTAIRDGEIVTAGGRVLCVTALGDTVAEAQARAYEALGRIRWDNAFWRTDIGHRAIGRERV